MEKANGCFRETQANARATSGAAPRPAGLSPMILRAFTLWALLSAGVFAGAPLASDWARPGADGKLAYKADARGNTIPDFSRAGYGGGGVRLPQVPVVATLEPQAAGDDTARIQAALDEVGRRPPDNRGLRGALLLRRGVYRVEGS